MTAESGFTPPVPEAPGAGDSRSHPEQSSVADLVVTAVTSVPGVSRMHPGLFGEVATYLPGRRVVGVQLREGVTNVHVVLCWGVALPETVDAIRSALLAVVHAPVHVTVEDIDAEPGPRT